MSSGWVKAHRTWADNPIIWKDSDHIACWMYLVLNAARAPTQAYFNGQIITLRAGEIVCGRRRIAESISVNESKIFRILKAFESARLIERQTCSKSSLISILVWQEEQMCEQQNKQQINSECTTSAQEMNIEQETKKKEKRNIFIKPSIEEIKSYCKERRNNVDPELFCDFYQARAWELSNGKKMKDWKAAIRTWERNDYNSHKKGVRTNDRQEYSCFDLSDL